MSQPKIVVFIPGWGFQHSCFDAIKAALPTDWHCMDLNYQDAECFDTYCAKTAETLPSNCLIVGWSLGGLIANQIAALRPDIQTLSISHQGNFSLLDELEAMIVRHQQNPITTLKAFNRWQAGDVETVKLCRSHLNLAAKTAHLQWLKKSAFSKHNNVTFLLGERDVLTEKSTQYRYLKDSGHALVLTHVDDILKLVNPA